MDIIEEEIKEINEKLNTQYTQYTQNLDNKTIESDEDFGQSLETLISEFKILKSEFDSFWNSKERRSYKKLISTEDINNFKNKFLTIIYTGIGIYIKFINLPVIVEIQTKKYSIFHSKLLSLARNLSNLEDSLQKIKKIEEQKTAIASIEAFEKTISKIDEIISNINELDSLNSTIEEDMDNIEVNIRDIKMDDNKVIEFFELLNETTTKIKDATGKNLKNKVAKEILYDVVLLYMRHLAIFQYLFLKYKDIDLQSIYREDSSKLIKKNINVKITEYENFYKTLDNLFKILQTSEQTEQKLMIPSVKYIDRCKYLLSQLSISVTNLQIKNIDISNYATNPIKYGKKIESIDAEIEEFKKKTNENFEIIKEDLKKFGLIITGGRKKPTKPKPKGKHDNMTMKDIKELCKANQIKLSRVVEGKHIVYNKKELLAKLLDAKIANPKPSDGHKNPTKPKGKHDDMKMKDINELCKANQIKLSRVVEGKRIAYKKKELITKLKRKKLL